MATSVGKQPASCQVQNQCPAGCNQCSLEKINLARNEHVRRGNRDKNAETFGDRETDRRPGHRAHLSVRARCGGSPKQRPAQPSSAACSMGVARSSAKKCWRVVASKRSLMSRNSFTSCPRSLFTASGRADHSGPSLASLQRLRQLSVTLCDSGQRSVKRAPPSGEAPALAVPPCCSSTSRAIARPRP